MAGCPNISQNILLSCEPAISTGVNDRLILIPFDAWSQLAKVVDGNNPLLYTDVATTSPAPGYQYEGKNSSVEPAARLVKLRYTEPYEHEVRFKIFSLDADIKQQVQRLTKKKVVAIVENNYRGEDGKAAFEVYGSEVGLELAEMERLPADPELGPSFNCLLKNSEFSRPGTDLHSIWNTDYATTKAIVDALVN